MRVTRIKAENFMRLTAADVELRNGVLEIVGKNMAGKSSLMTLVESLLGKRYISERPLHEGAKKGKAEISLGDDDGDKYVVKWRFTPKDSYVTVESCDGSHISKPQELLDSLVSKMVDPWLFARLATGSPADQRKAYEMVKPLMKFDYDITNIVDHTGYADDPDVKALMAEYADSTPLDFLVAFETFLSEIRKEWKKTAKEQEGRVDALKEQVPLDKRNAKVVSVGDLVENQQNQLEAARRRERAESRVEDAEAALKAAQSELEAAKAALEECPECGDPADYAEEIAKLEQNNEMARKAEHLKSEQQSLATAVDNVDVCEENIELVREAKSDCLASADSPTQGLSIEDGKILLNGLAWSNASRGESLAASLDIGIALKPGLNTFVCHDASLLDDDMRALIEKRAAENDVQVMLEVVGHESRPGVIFVEDGVAVNGESDA